MSDSTAINPGINRICLKLRLKTDMNTIPSPNNVPIISQGPSGLQVSNATPVHDPLLDSPFDAVEFNSDDIPDKTIYGPLLDIFFDIGSQHFPCIQRGRVEGLLEEGTMSAFLLSGEFDLGLGSKMQLTSG